MIRILYIIDGLRSGGKERRLLSLMKKLSGSKKYKIEAIILNSDIHFKDLFDVDINSHIIDRTQLSKYGVYQKVKKIKKEFNPDIVHSWDTLSTLYAIPITIFSKTKLITSKITDAPPSYTRWSVYGMFSEICFTFSDLILSNSNAGVLAYKASGKKSKVIHNGFDFTRLVNLKPQAALRDQIGVKEKTIISMAASFSENKDYKTYLEAAEIVLKKKNDIAFLCIGDGVLREGLEQTFTNKAIYFLGKRNDVESLMNISDVGVQMSNNKKHGEGISNSLMEYMALGKPVVASDNGGNKELILHNETGFILDTNNKEDLANRIIELLTNEGLKEKMGEKAKKRIENFFTIDRMVTEFLNVYEEVLSK